MENKVCICCGETGEWKKVTRLPAIIFGLNAEIYKCQTCGCAMTLPVPSTGQSFYEDNSRYIELFTERAELYKSFAAKLLSELDGLFDFKGKRLLDVASGSGYLVETALEKGFDAEGVDSNQQMVLWCEQRGLRITQGDAIELLGGSNEKYDVIVLSAIIEHIEDPSELINVCGKALEPGGVLLVSQAIYNGLLPKVFPWGWYGWQPKEHFWHFTDISLNELFTNMGYQIVRSNRFSLFHPWVYKGGIKEIVGRNVAALLARVSLLTGSEDGYNLILKKPA